MKSAFLSLAIICFFIISCQQTSTCPTSQLDSYLSNFERTIDGLLDSSIIATSMVEIRANTILAMLLDISDFKIVSAPECAQAHKESAISAMQQLVDAILNFDTRSILTESDLATLEEALLEIERLKNEAIQIESLHTK